MSELHKTKIGDVFFYGTRLLRRGRGILYMAHPSPPFMTLAYRERLRKRLWRNELERRKLADRKKR